MTRDLRDKKRTAREETQTSLDEIFEASPASSVTVLDFPFRPGSLEGFSSKSLDQGVSPSRSLQVATDIYWRGTLNQAGRKLGQMAEQGQAAAPHLAHVMNAMDRFLRFVEAGDEESGVQALTIATLELQKADTILGGN